MSEQTMQHRPPARSDSAGSATGIAGPKQAKLAQLASALNGAPAQLAPEEDELAQRAAIEEDETAQRAADGEEEEEAAQLKGGDEEEEPLQMQADVAINDDPALEQEADRMGEAAMRHPAAS